MYIRKRKDKDLNSLLEWLGLSWSMIPNLNPSLIFWKGLKYLEVFALCPQSEAISDSGLHLLYI